GYDQRVEIFGSGGSISTANRYENAATIAGRENVYRDHPLYFFLERYNDSYAAEMAAFVNAILEDEPSPVPGTDGRIAVEIGLAAGLSYRENRPVALLS
ncbi:MAG TPA: Gfo/Idh/MocA family oxidoreductase, partial [Ardenticatenaceae bacterium]|nr:Gfo/Idh/MocA family oxidoreductase [Ardenticatenaceae bacterium]